MASRVPQRLVGGPAGRPAVHLSCDRCHVTAGQATVSREAVTGGGGPFSPGRNSGEERRVFVSWMRPSPRAKGPGGARPPQ